MFQLPHLSAFRPRWTRATHVTTLLLSLAFTCLALAAVPHTAHASGVTNAADDMRTGWYPNSSRIDPTTVGGNTFGQLFNASVDGSVYAQPLLADGTLLVATENNKLYGLDPETGAQKWVRNDLGSAFKASDVSCSDLTPNIGVTGTPVVDDASHTAYMFSKEYVSGTSGPVKWWAHAVDVTTGAERPGFPVEIKGDATNQSGLAFDPLWELQRPGLLLMNGTVYAAFGGHCDHGPWHGWVVGVHTFDSATAPATVSTLWATTDASAGAGIWQSGAGIMSDGSGRMFIATGNGGAQNAAIPGNTPPAECGECVLRLDVQADGSLKAKDFFAPQNAQFLDSWDADFASGGTMGLPDQFGSAQHPHLLVTVGKEGYVYLLDRDHLGGEQQGPSAGDDVVAKVGRNGGVWSRPALWPGDGGWVYIPTATPSGSNSAGGSGGFLRAYQLGKDGSGQPTISLASATNPPAEDAFGFSSSAAVVTSSGTTSGSALVWVVWSKDGSGADAQLRAYLPTPGSDGRMQQVYAAPIGTSSKFAIPGVGNVGDATRIYVGTRDGHVQGYGAPIDPALTGDPVTFARTTVGDSQSRNVVFNALRDVTVSAASVSGTGFSIGATTPAIPAGGLALHTGDTLTVQVAFSPAASGLASGAVRLTTNDLPYAIGLNGSGQAATAELTASTSVVSFGGLRAGGSGNDTITLTNTGAEPLTFTGVYLPESPFTATGLPKAGSTLASGASLTVTVGFAPTTLGDFEDAISFSSNGGTQTIGLSGSGAPAPALQFDRSQLDLGSVPVGASTTGTFTIRNTGGSSLQISISKPPTAQDTPFTAVSTLNEGTTIAPGQSLTETVRFSPTTAGAQNDIWEIGSDDGAPRHEFVLTGTGVAALPVSNPATDASDWQLNGTAAIQGAALRLTSSAPISQAGSAFWTGGPIGTRSFTVSFDARITDPTNGGADGMALVLADPSKGATTTSLGNLGGALGYSGTPGILGVAIGLDTYQNGNDPSGNFLGIATGATPPGSDTLAWLQTTSLEDPVPTLDDGNAHHVIVTRESGHLIVSIDGHNVLDTTIALPPYVLLGFSAGTGDYTETHDVEALSVAAGSGGALSVSTVGSGSVTPDVGSLDCTGATCAAAYMPGQSVTLTAVPDAGRTFTSWGGDCSGTQPTCTIAVDDASSVTATFSAGAGQLAAPSRLAVGQVLVNTTGTATLTLTNPGDSPVTITAATGADAPFSVVGPSLVGAIVPADGSLVETIAYAPTTAGVQNATLALTAAGTTQTVRLGGTGVEAATVPAPNATDWELNGATSVAGNPPPTIGSDGTIHLTPQAGWAQNAPWQAGSAFYKTPLSSRNATVDFDASFHGGSGADGLTVTFADPDSPTLIGQGGGGLGYSGITGTAVGMFTYYNGGPQTGRAGIATGGNGDQLQWLIGPNDVALRDGTDASHHVKVQLVNGEMHVSVDGTELFKQAVTLPPNVLIGFTGGTGGANDEHDVSNVAIVAAPKVDVTQPLTVSLLGSGTGVVSSIPTGIDCGTSCGVDMVQGQVVSLTATAATGSGFSGWTGDCTGQGNTCSVTMAQARSVTARFDLLAHYPVSVVLAGTGHGSVASSPGGVDCPGICVLPDVASGESVTLTATPGPDSVFTGWSGPCPGTGTCDVDVHAIRTIRATFTLKPSIHVSVTVGGAVKGAGIDCGTTCNASYDPGADPVELTAIPATGYSFAGWSGSCTGTGTCTLPLDGSQTVSASFTPIPVENPPGTPGAPPVATPPVGTPPVGTPVGGDPGAGSPEPAPYSGPGTTPTSSTAALRVTISGHGRVRSGDNLIACSRTCRHDYVSGTTVKLTASPAAGWRLVRFAGSCVGTRRTCSVTTGASASNVSVRFVRSAPVLTRLTVRVTHSRHHRAVKISFRVDRAVRVTVAILRVRKTNAQWSWRVRRGGSVGRTVTVPGKVGIGRRVLTVSIRGTGGTTLQKLRITLPN